MTLAPLGSRVYVLYVYIYTSPLSSRTYIHSVHASHTHTHEKKLLYPKWDLFSALPSSLLSRRERLWVPPSPQTPKNSLCLITLQLLIPHSAFAVALNFWLSLSLVVKEQGRISHPSGCFFTARVITRTCVCVCVCNQRREIFFDDFGLNILFYFIFYLNEN